VSILYGWKRFTAIAAVLLLLVVATWLFTAKNNERIITVTAATANQQVQLPDGTIVNLRKAATISYPESFVGTRKVTLTGEAFFDVVHDEKSKFTITTSHTVIEDIGTTFVVTNSPAKDQIVVITGKVKCADIQTGKKTALLVAGQKAIYDSAGLSVSKVTDSNFISWKTGVLNFPASVLPDVLEEVSHFYGVTVTCLPDAATDRLTLHLHFENQPLEQVLDEIKLATGLQCKKDGKQYLFYR
jgi:ferric-dicitrate binding protein FerR (iron transport regulator)